MYVLIIEMITEMAPSGLHTPQRLPIMETQCSGFLRQGAYESVEYADTEGWVLDLMISLVLFLCRAQQ